MDSKPDLQAQIQRTLGDTFALERELGGGGMSRVFVAHDQQLGRRVVIKTLAGDVGASLSAERFRREIRVAASLQQANIVPVHSAGDIDGLPYYTMPFVEGESLRARLDARGALDARDSVNILRDVARALAYAHERGVVHRDIKPENILLSGSTAVVTDFGIAKAIEASHSLAPQATLTQLGTFLGTPMYVAPEQAAGDPNVDHLADIYSLGVVAYEMLAGERPFTGTVARNLLAAHISESPPPLAGRRDGIPPRLAALVMRCLEKDPSRRPQGAAALLDALDSVLAGGAVAAATTTPSIAVLPFANLSPDPADGFFADGLTDEIITDLSGIKSLRVIARAAMMRYKGTEKEPAAVARELRVRYVLDGSVRRAAASLRLTARLIDADTDTTIWSDKLNGAVEDVFDMQERISRTIVEALRITLTPKEAERLGSRAIEDIQAYETYLQAKQAMWSFTPESLERARKLLEAARARIGENPRLVAALGTVHMHGTEAGFGDPRTQLAAVEDCVRRLNEIDPESVSRYALAGILHWRRGEIREAIATMSRALEIEPNSPDVVAYLQYALLLAGQDERARELSSVLILLDPLTPLFQTMPAFCDLMIGRAEAALPAYQRFVELDPANPIAQYFLLAAQAEAHDLGAMRETAQTLGRTRPDSVLGAFGAMLAREILQRPEARHLVIAPELRAMTASSESIARTQAVILARLGGIEQALDALECAIALGFAHYPYMARDSRAMASLRQHPRFRELLEVVRARWERGGTSAADLAETRGTAALLATGAISMPGTRTPNATAGAPKRSVAVLPFVNLSPDPENEFFADGITDDLIAQVAKVGGLRVIARTSVMRFRGVNVAPRQAAAELGVTSIVEGTVRRAGKRARIVAQLIDVPTEAPIWSETYDRDLDDLFSVQSEVAASIAAALQTTLTPGERRRLGGRAAVDAETYDLYLRGRHHWSKRTDDSIRRAIEYFERCIRRAPDCAPAHGGLADAYVFAALGYATMDAAEAFARARAAAERALAVDPESPEALCALALYAMHHDWKTETAQELLERAIAHNANYVPAHQWLAWAFFSQGDYVGAARVQRHALTLDPLSVTLVTESGWPFGYAGLHELALARYRRALELDPSFALAHYNVGATHHSLGRYAEAFAAYDRAIAGLGRVGFVLAWLALAYVETGRRDEATRILKELEDQSRTDVRAWIPIALAADALGDVDRAIAALEAAFAARAPFVAGLALEGWIVLRNTRPTHQFRALLDRIGVKSHDVARQRELLLEFARDLQPG